MSSEKPLFISDPLCSCCANISSFVGALLPRYFSVYLMSREGPEVAEASP